MQSTQSQLHLSIMYMTTLPTKQPYNRKYQNMWISTKTSCQAVPLEGWTQP